MSFKEEEQEEGGEEAQEPQEPSFRKVDKRHSARAGADEESAAEEVEQAEPEPEAAEETAAEEEPLAEVDVYDTLRFVISMLARQAWIMMGVQIERW